MPTVNMRQIARRANVSASTVSVVLNRTKGVAVSDATRERVLRVASRAGYARAALARAIKSPLRHLGIAVGDLDEAHQAFTSVIFQAAHQLLLERGYHPVLLPVGDYHSETKADVATVPARVIDLHRSRLVDGVVLDKQHFLDAEVRRIFEGRVPIVVVNGGSVQRIRPGVVVPSVTIHDEVGGRLATEHLLALHHRRIGLVSRPYREGPRAYHSVPVMALRQGYNAALRDAGVADDPAMIAEGDPLDKAATYAAIGQLMAGADPPTALIVGDDQMAIMAINALRRLGRRVPDDVSVVGYGDLAAAGRLVEPELTTVRLPLKDNGRTAADNLITLLESGGLERPVVVLEPSLVVRGTTLRR